jgi:hypothetical protein
MWTDKFNAMTAVAGFAGAWLLHGYHCAVNAGGVLNIWRKFWGTNEKPDAPGATPGAAAGTASLPNAPVYRPPT